MRNEPEQLRRPQAAFSPAGAACAGRLHAAPAACSLLVDGGQPQAMPELAFMSSGHPTEGGLCFEAARPLLEYTLSPCILCWGVVVGVAICLCATCHHCSLSHEGHRPRRPVRWLDSLLHSIGIISDASHEGPLNKLGMVKNPPNTVRSSPHLCVQ